MYEFERRLAKNNLKILQNKLRDNIYDESLCKMILIQRNDLYSEEEVNSLIKYLNNSNIKISEFILKFLCKNGHKINEFIDFIKNSKDGLIITTSIDIAKEQKDRDVLLELLNEKGSHLIKVIYAIRDIGEKDLLAPLLFSDNEEISNLARKICF